MPRFAEPWFLILLLPVLVGLILSFRHVHGMAKSRKRFAFVLRFVLASLMVGALAEPHWRQRNSGACTIFVLDRSDSIPSKDIVRAERFVSDAIQSMGPNDMSGVIAFGQSAVVDRAPGGRRALGPIQSKVDASATDLASAIRLATANFPQGKTKRIVLLTDGAETAGDAIDPADIARQDGVTIDTVTLGERGGNAEALVASLTAPLDVRTGQPFELRAVVESTGPATATLELDKDGRLVKRVPINLAKGANAVLIPDTLHGPGFVRYRARLVTDADSDARNNIGVAFALARGRTRVLVLQEDPRKSELAEALRRSGIETDVAGPGRAPYRTEQFLRYDAIVFNDINAASLLESQMKLIQSAVRDGGVGLAMIGGENSFLPGGYYGTPIAEALPVDLDVRQRKTFPSTSVVVIVDCSGSMAMIEDGIQKLRMAAKAAEQTVQLMGPRDKVGVAGSSDGIEWVAPLQPLDDKMKVIQQIRKLDVSGGGIYIGPSVAAADAKLSADDSKVRHLILLADGADSTDWRDALQRAARMRSGKITTTVVAIGDGKFVPELRRLAAVGGGRFFLATKARQLPAMFTQDAAIVSRSAIEEGSFIPRISAWDDALRGLSATPELGGYCLTDGRPLARVMLRTHKDDPLLARWQYGLGKSLAFTSDAQSRWARLWVGWEGFSPFWSQAVRSIGRSVSDNQYQVSASQSGGRGTVELRGVDRLGNPLDGRDLAVRISGPGGQPQEVALAQVAPGAFTGQFSASDVGAYVLTVAEPDGRGGQRVTPSGFAIAYPAEYRTLRANTQLLERLTAMTGGRELEAPAQAYRAVPDPGESTQEAWPALVLAAALLLPVDVGARRVAISMIGLLRQFRWRKAPASTPLIAADRLRTAKSRAKTNPSSSPVASAPAEVPTHREPTSRTPTTPGAAAATSLLEAKRRRQEKDGGDGERKA